MVKTQYSTQAQKTVFPLIVCFLTFQSPLESVHPLFSYIDELVALMGACLGMYDVFFVRKCRPSKDQLAVGVPLLLFIAVGLLGNILYRYQPLKSVIIDLYTNLKFFFAIGTGYYLYTELDWQEKGDIICKSARMIVLILFAIFVVDRVFMIWPDEVRYGIVSARLFYYHPTYLAGAVAFLVMLLTVFYQKRNLIFISMVLVIMFFTLRAKAFASIVAYVAMFVFFAVWKKELKLWHAGVLGAGCLAVAWNKFSYYFIELAGRSARSVLLLTSLEIAKDYFPIGTGFGTYASAEAAKHYSPVYRKYDFHLNWELRDVNDTETALELIDASDYLTELYNNNPAELMQFPTFLSDSFWPILLGQTGILGTLIYTGVLGVILVRCQKVKKHDLYAFVGLLFAMVYLFISSMAEPAFHNSVSIGFAFVIGMVFQNLDRKKS